MKQQPSPAPPSKSKPLPPLADILAREIACRLTQPGSRLYVQGTWNALTEPRPGPDALFERVNAIVLEVIGDVCHPVGRAKLYLHR